MKQSLGYGTYTVQVNSPVDHLDLNTVVSPPFIYADTSHELDNEYSGSGRLIPVPYNAQFVVQPYLVSGNLFRCTQPSMSQSTTQMEWHSDHVTFRAWNGWSSNPAPADVIQQWTYTGSYMPRQGLEAVHIHLWLYGGRAPVSGTGDELVIHSFDFQSYGLGLSVSTVGNGVVTTTDGAVNCHGSCCYLIPPHAKPSWIGTSVLRKTPRSRRRP